jgi:uncharacterized protein (TIGR03435 family)
MRREVATTILMTLISSMAFGQSPETQLSFEVASVKPSGPRSVRMFDGGPGTHDPGRISYTKATLHDVLVKAWGLEDYQQISGPGWLGVETYDILATIPPGTTKEQFQMMLRTLVAERFQLALHHVTRDFPVYELVPGKNGPKLTKSGKQPQSKSTTNKPGFPELPTGRPSMIMRNEANGVTHLAAHQEPLSALARMLRLSAGRVIVDKTGLPGEYDFTLEFRYETGAPLPLDDVSAPSLFDALQQQLGLKLLDSKTPFDILVIDHAEKVPTEN